MATSPPPDVILSAKNYRQIATDMFQGYADERFEGKLLWRSMKIDFKYWTKEHWDALDGKTWNKILGYCIPRGVWIEESDNQSEVLMKLVSAPTYDIDLEDWDMDRIDKVAKTFGKVSRGIHLRLQHLRGEEPEEIQQFQDTGFQTPAQQSEVAPLYPNSSKSLPYEYRRHQSQKQEPPLFSQQTLQHPGQLFSQQAPPPQHPGPSSSQKQPFVSQNVRNQQYQPTHGIQHAHENQYRPSNYQLASSPVLNICQYSKEPPIQVSPAQVPPAHTPPVQALPASVPLASNDPGCKQPRKPPERVNIFDAFTDGDIDAKLSQYPASRQEEIAGPLAKDVFKVVTPEEFVTPDEVVTPEEISSNTQVFNSCFVDDIKNPGTHKDYEQSRLVVQADNDKDKNLELTQSPIIQQAYDLDQDFYIRPFPKLLSLPGASSDCIVKVMKPMHDVPEASTTSYATYHPHYKEKSGMTESAYKPSLLRPPPQLLSPPAASSNYIVKVIKPLYDVREASITRFAIYHPHYKDKLVSNPTRTFVCATNYLYSLCVWSNLSEAFFITHDGSACTAEPSLVTKKGEPPRTSLHLLSCLPSLPSLLFSLTLSKMRPAISECSAMSKCATMSEWQFSLSALANFPLLADYSSVKLTSEVSLDLFRAAQTVKFSPDDNALLNKRLQWQITDKFRGLRHVKLGQDTLHVLAIELYAMAHKFDIEKQHWGRYQIMQKKSCQHQHYGMGGTGKYKTGKDGTSEYWHLATFRKSCQCRDVGSQLMLGM